MKFDFDKNKILFLIKMELIFDKDKILFLIKINFDS